MSEAPVRGKPISVRRPAVASLALLLCLLLAGSPAAVARTNDSTSSPYQAMGTLLTSGAVSLNGVGALPNTTVYAGDRLRTSPGSAAILTTPDGSRIQVLGGSEVTINGGPDGVELSLPRGIVEVRSPAERGAAIVADEVRARSRGRVPAVFRFDHRGDDIRVTSYQGAVEISGILGGPAVVSAGELAWLAPQQDPQTKPQPPYPAGAGKEQKEKRENARPRLALYLLLGGAAVAGLVTGIILAVQSDPRP